jgi:hypothetical protein
LKHLVQSPARIAALGKYLTALANTFNADVNASRAAREPSSKRKRLHMLYLLNDVLYHVHVRDRQGGFSSLLEQFLPGLVQSAACFSNCPKHTKKINELVKLWEDQKYFSPAFVGKLESTIRDAPTSDASATNGSTNGTTATGIKLPKDVPFIMPSMHGDASIPWYDLPAANWLPVIEPNSTRAMNPSMIKPLRFVSGPADKTLVKAVQDLLADVDRIYAKDYRLGEDPAEDIDQLGQRITIDEITGDVIRGETYYGWSRTFCERMKKRRKKANGSDSDQRGRSLSRSRSRSSSRSASRPGFKRRRMSNSQGSHSMSPGRSRSRSRRRSHNRERRRQRSYSSSRSRSRPRSIRHERSRSRSPDRGLHPPPPGYNNPGGNGKPPNYPNPNTQFPVFPSNVPFPFPGAALPPPPPNWQGTWPPPPPPPPSMIGSAPNPWMSGVPPPPTGGWGGSSVPPPPPPPIGQPNLHNQQQGQGSQYPPAHGGRGDYRGGRGGWRGNRGGW